MIKAAISLQLKWNSKFKVGEILWAKTPIRLYLSTLSPTKFKDYMTHLTILFLLLFWQLATKLVSYIYKAILKFGKKICQVSFQKIVAWYKFPIQEQCSGHQLLASCNLLYYKLPVFKRIPHSLHLINFLLWCGRSKYYSILIKKN